MSQQVFVVIDGAQQGPYTQGQIRQMVAGGTLDPRTLCWYEGLSRWTPIEEALPEVLPAVSAPQPVTPAGPQPTETWPLPQSTTGYCVSRRYHPLRERRA